MPQLQYAIGVDLGGTTIKTGIVSSDGKIIVQSKFPTLGEQGPKTVIGQIRKSIEEVLPHAKGKTLRGIGIGSPGIVDEKGGIVKDPPNFADWHNVALGNAVAKIFRLSAKVENDANVAAIAEAKFGAGKRPSKFSFRHLGDWSRRRDYSEQPHLPRSIRRGWRNRACVHRL